MKILSLELLSKKQILALRNYDTLRFVFLQCRFLILRNPINTLHNKGRRKIHANTQFILDNISHVYTDLQICLYTNRDTFPLLLCLIFGYAF